MALQDYFGGNQIAYNPDTESLVTNAEFEVFDASDLSFSTPLAVFEPVSGAAIGTLRSTKDGVLPDFRVAGDPGQVIVRSGAFATKLTSLYGALRDAGFDPEKVDRAASAVDDAEAARDAAVAARNAAQQAVDSIPEELDTEDGVRCVAPTGQ